MSGSWSLGTWKPFLYVTHRWTVQRGLEGVLAAVSFRRILISTSHVGNTHCNGFPGGAVLKNLPADAGDAGLIPSLGRSPGGGNGNLLQYSCLERPKTEKPSGLQSMGSWSIRQDWTWTHVILMAKVKFKGNLSQIGVNPRSPPSPNPGWGTYNKNINKRLIMIYLWPRDHPHPKPQHASLLLQTSIRQCRRHNTSHRPTCPQQSERGGGQWAEWKILMHEVGKGGEKLCLREEKGSPIF